MMLYFTICILVNKLLIDSELIQKVIFRERFDKDKIVERNSIVFIGNYGKTHKRQDSPDKLNTPFIFVSR